jgi:Ca2+-binding RTX toxin-like protein
VVFYGGASGDVLTAAGAANDMLIAGAGSESLLGGTATGTLVMEGSSGSDIMTASTGHTDFTVGTGNDTITDGGIADIIAIAKGHAGGLDLINNFRTGVDELDLVGYSASTASNAISSQMSDGHGGTLLFLPDGTRLDLVGIAHATSSVFT